jgi:DNA-binding beta-propeller fold protein YncE
LIPRDAVGGVTIDLVGNIYIADFGDFVWKITPEGERHEFASGLYGASGNAIDKEGNLLQSNLYADSITKIDRKGQAKAWVTSGLSGPVGIAVDSRTGDVYISNCSGNSIARIAMDGAISSFAESDLLRCPNGISFDGGGNLFVVNFRNNPYCLEYA